MITRDSKRSVFRKVCALFGVTDVRILDFPRIKPFHNTPEAGGRAPADYL